MVRGCKAFLTALVLLAGCSAAFAQETTIGAGKIEIGGFPGGGTFFVSGDDNTEVNFNVYTAGGDITYYINPKAAVEGEFTGSVGWAQDVFFKNKKVIHSQMPGVWSYMANVVVFPGGTTGKRVPYYLTGGAGMLSLQPRIPDAQFGYGTGSLCPCPGWQTFVAKTSAAASRFSARPTRRTGASASITACCSSTPRAVLRPSSRRARAAARIASISACSIPGSVREILEFQILNCRLRIEKGRAGGHGSLALFVFLGDS